MCKDIFGKNIYEHCQVFLCALVSRIVCAHSLEGTLLIERQSAFCSLCPDAPTT